MLNFKLIFDEVIFHQLKNESEDLKEILSKMFDKIEEKGPRAGKLIDSHLFIYEMKSKRPPLRLYFKHVKDSNYIYLFEYEMKTSEKKQKRIINRIRDKVYGLFKLKP